MAEEMTRPRKGSLAAGVVFAENDIGGFEGDGEGDEEAARPLNTGQLGLWALLATLTMLFAGFTSAYLVRRAGTDWRPISLPSIVWLNTVLLFSSSVTLEVARASLRRCRTEALKGWLLVTTLLGLAFLVGQLLAWQQLTAQGVYLPTNPHSSFFYMLTGVHGMHVLGGLSALLYALNRAWGSGWTAAEPNSLNLCATYWHFVDGVWLYLFFLLLVW